MTDLLRFGTVGSPQTTPDSGTPAAIKHTRDLGLDHLEIAWTRSVSATPATCAAIKAAAEQYRVSLSVHAPYFINLNSQTDDKMQKSDARLLAAARAGYLCGAHDIVFHPASYHTQPPEDVYPRVRDQLLQIVETLQSEGVTVNLRPETMGKSAMFGTLAETVRLSADIPHVLPCIDWAHLYARDGKGSFNTPDHFRAALDLVGEQLGEHGLKQVHFHISGIDYTPKGERAHIPMYQSVQRFPELFDLFVEYELAGTVGVEAPEPFHTADALTMQALYRHRRDLLAGKGTQRAEDADDE